MIAGSFSLSPGSLSLALELQLGWKELSTAKRKGLAKVLQLGPLIHPKPKCDFLVSCKKNIIQILLLKLTFLAFLC